MGVQFDIAVVGAGTLVGETLVSLLEERDFPVGQLYLLDAGDSAGGRLEFKGRHLRVQELNNFDFSKVRIAFFAAGAEVSREYAPRAVAAGAVVLDNSPEFRQDPDVPLVVPEVNPEAIAGYGRRGIIANPCCNSIQLAVALKPLLDVAGVEHVSVVTFQAVSGKGREGVEELARQTAHLLNAKPFEPRVFSRQIAFNVIPKIDTTLESGYTEEEMKLVRESRRIFADERLAVNVTTVRVPVFFGHAAAVNVRTKRKLTAQEARNMLLTAPALELLDEQEGEDDPTPVTEAVGTDAVWVGRIREDLSSNNGLDLWLVTDNVRKGAALNSIQIAEILVKDLL